MELIICARTKGSLSLSVGPFVLPTPLMWLLGWKSPRAGCGRCGGCSVPATGRPQSDCKLQRDQHWIQWQMVCSPCGQMACNSEWVACVAAVTLRAVAA